MTIQPKWSPAPVLSEADLKAAQILIVDDQTPSVLLLDKLLRSDGYERIAATTDPREVTDLYRDLRPDIVLLDIRMPHLDGFEVLGRLQAIEQQSYLPVIVLTAQTDRETCLRALESGAKDFVGKPFDRLEILNRVRNMLEVRLLHRHLREHNRLLEKRVDERTQEIQEARLEVVQRLGRAAEFRDNETGMHVQRIGRGAGLLAARLGLPTSASELIMEAAPMHDIGKIGIPDAVLLKPGKLDPHEWEIMKTHTAIGARILSGGSTPLLQMAERIALSHHERWDGTGYPAGLAGDDIPIEGRLAAVVDVFDALVSERPYKQPWPLEKAVACIRESAGSHFDPTVVEAFVDGLHSILTIRDELSDSETAPPA